MDNTIAIFIFIALAIIILLMVRGQKPNSITPADLVDLSSATNLLKIDCSQIQGQQYQGTLKIPGVGEVYCDGLMTCKDGKITCSPQTYTPTYYTSPIYILRRGGFVHQGGMKP